MPLDIMGFGQTLILILPKTMWEWALLFGYLLLFFFLFKFIKIHSLPDCPGISQVFKMDRSIRNFYSNRLYLYII